MPRLCLAIAALPWLALLVACEPSPTSLAGCHLPSKATVLAIGDSLTRGYGADGEGYAEQLQRLEGDGVSVVVRGVDGERSEGLLARIDDALAEHSPALVLLTSGGNDVLRRVPSAQTRDHLRSVAARIRAAGAQPVIFAVPRPGIGALAGQLDDDPVFEALGDDLHVIPGVVSTVLGDEALKSDAIHPNRAGYARMAQAAQAVLRQCR